MLMMAIEELKTQRMEEDVLDTVNVLTMVPRVGRQVRRVCWNHRVYYYPR